MKRIALLLSIAGLLAAGACSKNQDHAAKKDDPPAKAADPPAKPTDLPAKPADPPAKPAVPSTHATLDAACEHTIEIGYWDGFDKEAKQGGSDPTDRAIHAQGMKGLAEQKASKEWKDQVAQCTAAAAMATEAQIDCIMAANKPDDVTACESK